MMAATALLLLLLPLLLLLILRPSSWQRLGQRLAATV